MIELSVIALSSLKEKSIGLIGKTKIEPVLFKTHFGIHTFGMKQAIDVLILDEENRVVKLKENLKPNRLWFWNLKYEKVVELPGGTIEEQKIRRGSQIKVIEKQTKSKEF